MINDAQIKRFSFEQGLISPFSEKQLQPHSYDCRLGGNFKVPIKEKKGIFKDVNLTEGEIFRLPPSGFALAHTAEVISLPKILVGFCAGKSSIARNGLVIESAGLIDAEFSGEITLEFQNQSPWTLELPVGILICQVYFVEVEAPQVKSYSKIGHYNSQRGAKPPVFNLYGN